MNPSVYNRIDYKGPIEKVLEKIVKDFKLGKFESFELPSFGYEDFNVKLKTDKGKFFVKIFGSYRDKEECEQYVYIMQLVRENGINYPFLYFKNNEPLYRLKIDNASLTLVVQEFIEGKNFIELSRKPNEEEKEFILKEASIVNKINFKPKPVYDTWAIVNFEKEFKKRTYCLKILKKEVEELLSEFKKIKLDTLPHCFVHGDMIASNIMKDINKKIWVLDFACSNYYPRIIELSALICFNFFNPDKPESLKSEYEFALKTYQKFTELNENEVDLLPIFIKASFAMYLIRANFEKEVNKNETEENQHWLRVGEIGLRESLKLWS